MTREASPTLTWNSVASATSIGSHTRMDAMLLNAARLISHKPGTREEDMQGDCRGKHAV